LELGQLSQNINVEQHFLIKTFNLKTIFCRPVNQFLGDRIQLVHNIHKGYPYPPLSDDKKVSMRIEGPDNCHSPTTSALRSTTMINPLKKDDCLQFKILAQPRKLHQDKKRKKEVDVLYIKQSPLSISYLSLNLDVYARQCLPVRQTHIRMDNNPIRVQIRELSKGFTV
jgi:hypothetical protein